MFRFSFFYIVDITVSIYISNLRHCMQRGPRSAPVFPTDNFQNTDTAELDEIRQLATIILSHPKTKHLLSGSS